MQVEPHDWSVPAPLRALLWWPPVALVVAMVEPSAAAGTIAVSGALLAVLGVLVSTVGRALADRLAGSRPAAESAAVLAMPEAVAPVTAEQRVA